MQTIIDFPQQFKLVSNQLLNEDEDIEEEEEDNFLFGDMGKVDALVSQCKKI
jgi:hypothetical protein